MEQEVTMTVKAPIDCTDEQFREWVEFCLGNRASMSTDNPLHEYDIEAKDVCVG